MYLCFFSFIIIFCSFDFSSFFFFSVRASFLVLIPCFYVWVPTFLAELNRSPFDFSEGERELVRGFNTEHGSLGFTLIFLAEYGNILIFCLVSGFLFFHPIRVRFFISVFFVV